MKRTLAGIAAAFGLATMSHAQVVQVQQLPVAQAPLPAITAIWCATPLGLTWKTYQCQVSQIASYLTGGVNSWTGSNTFTSAIVTGGSVDNAVLGGATPAAATVTTLFATGAATLSAGLSPSGTFTLNGATAVTVANAAVTANSLIIITLKTVHGSVGAEPHVSTITPGTGFTVVGTAADLSVYNYGVIG